MEIDTGVAAFSAVVLFVAYVVRGIAGFGSGLISVPLLALFFPLQLVVPVIVLLDYVGSASQGLRNRKVIAWREQLPLIPFTLIGVGIGLSLLQSLNSATLAQALGVFIMVYGVYQLLPLPELRGSRLFAVPGGALGGLIGTVFGAGGPFYIIYLGLRGLDKNALRATFAANFLIDGGIRLVGYTAFGFFDRAALLYIAAALPIVAIALFLGGRVHSSLSPVIFTRLISVLLLVSGVALLLKY
ncbi:MAG: putative membrane protein YfcA [Paracoccaceae bacterium]